MFYRKSVGHFCPARSRDTHNIRRIGLGTMVAFPNIEWAFEDTGLDRPNEKSKDRTSRIACEVLRYLLEHPDAQDTVQGITDWWLMERRIDEQSALVKAALARLVDRGFVVEERRGALQLRYRINRGRYEEILQLTKK